MVLFLNACHLNTILDGLRDESNAGVVDHSKPYFNDKSLALWKFPLPLPKLPEENENKGIPLPYQTDANKRKDTNEENVQEMVKSQWQSHFKSRENMTKSKSKEKHSHSNEYISLPLPSRDRFPNS